MVKNKIYKFGAAIALVILAVVLFAFTALPYGAALPQATEYGVVAQDAQGWQSGELKVHFVDVKQGDCILIQLPDGKNMIIDAGSGTSAPSAMINSVKSYITYTLGEGFKYFDYAILTHADSDHCNILDDVLNAFPSYVCYRPNLESTDDPGKADLTSGADKKTTATYKNVITAMYQKIEGTDSTVYVTDPADEAQTITGGDGADAYSFTFFSPLSEKYSDSNDYSPIMLLEYRGFKFALSGDAEKQNEREFVEKVNAAKTDGKTDKYDIFTDDFTVDVFKAGHHGSETSSSQAYLDVMTTADGAANAYYVFSCNAEGNKYKHPRQDVLDRITAMGATNDKIVRTDHHGSIVFSVSNTSGTYELSCVTEKAYDGDNTVGADTATSGGNTGGNTGENTGGNIGDNTGGNTGGNTGDNTADGENGEPQEPTFFEKYRTYIIIAVVVIVVIILIIFIVLKMSNKNNDDGRHGGHGSGGAGKRKAPPRNNRR